MKIEHEGLETFVVFEEGDGALRERFEGALGGGKAARMMIEAITDKCAELLSAEAMAWTEIRDAIEDLVVSHPSAISYNGKRRRFRLKK